MSRQRRLFLVLVILAILGLTCLAWLVSSFDPDTVKENLATRIAAVSGLRVEIKSNAELHLLPPAVTLTGIVLRDEKSDVLTVKRARAQIALWPLLRREVRITTISLDEPKLAVRRDLRLGILSGTQGKPAAQLVAKVRVRNGTVTITGENGQTALNLAGLDFDLAGFERNETGRLSFSGTLLAGRVESDRFEVSELSGVLTGDGDTYQITPLRGRLFDSAAQGEFQLDLNGKPPAWRLKLTAEELSLATLSQSLAGGPLFEGAVKLQADLSGKSTAKFAETLSGTLKVSGIRLVQHGFDFDRFIRRYRDSRDIDLVDIGVYAFAGPVGALVSKGVDVVGLVWPSGGNGRQVIEELVFNWSLQDGIAKAEDVAMRTRENRLALKGTVDLGEGRYDEVFLGLLNARGCAELTEKISGPLEHPKVEKSSILKTLAGSFLGVLQQGWEILDPGDCQPFYTGAVTDPGKE